MGVRRCVGVWVAVTIALLGQAGRLPSAARHGFPAVRAVVRAAERRYRNRSVEIRRLLGVEQLA